MRFAILLAAFVMVGCELPDHYPTRAGYGEQACAQHDGWLRYIRVTTGGFFPDDNNVLICKDGFQVPAPRVFRQPK